MTIVCDSTSPTACPLYPTAAPPRPALPAPLRATNALRHRARRPHKHSQRTPPRLHPPSHQPSPSAVARRHHRVLSERPRPPASSRVVRKAGRAAAPTAVTTLVGDAGATSVCARATPPSSARTWSRRPTARPKPGPRLEHGCVICTSHDSIFTSSARTWSRRSHGATKTWPAS